MILVSTEGFIYKKYKHSQLDAAFSRRFRIEKINVADNSKHTIKTSQSKLS
jgi:hypothetical protein